MNRQNSMGRDRKKNLSSRQIYGIMENRKWMGKKLEWQLGISS